MSNTKIQSHAMFSFWILIFVFCDFQCLVLEIWFLKFF